MTVPVSEERRQSAAEDPPASLHDSVVVQFPSFPRDSYSPRPTDRMTIAVDRGEAAPATESSVENLLKVAWALVLADQTNSPEVVFGMAHHGWTTDDGEQAIMPFQFLLRAEDTVEEALATAALTSLQMRQWEHMGHRKYSTMIPRNMVLCQFRNLLVVDHKDANDDSVTPSPNSYSEEYALTVRCESMDNAVIRVDAIFDPVVLPEGRLRMMLDQFSDILKTLLSNVPCAIKDLQHIGPEGLKQLRKWNQDGEFDEGIVCVSDLIEERFKQTPLATAVSAWDGTLTYGELDRWASHIAVHLVQSGVTPGIFVGIYMPKSVLAVVAMVATIKSGGAFVFLPPSLPTARLQLTCQITPVRLVLSIASHHNSALELPAPAQVIDHLDKDAGDFDALTSWCSEAAQPDHPIYAIFTSGSTGEPKGVVIDRASFGPGVREYCRRGQLGHDSRLFQSVSYTFVVSILEQLLALAGGACICIPSEEQLQNDMEGAIWKHQASWASMTPSVARMLKAENLTSLKSLVLAGEPVTQSDLEQWKAHTSVYTMYGQSETGSTLLIDQLTGSLEDSCGLGRPSTGACWIVHPEDPTILRPLGAEGELLIESTALASRYMNNPAESARTFIEMPRWLRQLRPPEHRSRCLLTGDIAYYHDKEGTIRLLSRKGTGTKIRGQRVELGEIECQLRPKFPNAREVLVEVIRPAGASDKHSVLVAFVNGPGKVTSETGLLATASTEFRSHARRAIAELCEILPSFMVPIAIVPLRTVPTTATGKVHRKSLREMMSALTLAETLAYNQENQVAYRAPITDDETFLLSMCQELLRLPASSISLDDDFFHAGGDSLTARQLAMMARSNGRSLLVADIFEAPSLALLASRIRHDNQIANGTKGVPEPDPFRLLKLDFLSDLPVFLAKDSIQDVHPTLDMQAKAVRAGMVDYFPFHISGQLNRQRLRHACETVIRETSVLRSVFTSFRGKLLQITLHSMDTPYEELTVPDSEDAFTQARLHIAEDKKKTPKPDRPHTRFTLFCQSPEEHIFVLRIPHAMYDGGCLNQIGKQISAAYNDQTAPIATKFSVYARHCARLRTPSAIDFWSDLLAGSEVTRLPRVSHGEGMPGIYPGGCSPSSPPRGITMATAIKAAWAWVLHQRTGKSDVLFGQVGSTRGADLPGATDIVGMCLNITAVRVQFSGLETAYDLFRMLQQQHTRALLYETIGWTDIVTNGTSWPEGTELDSLVLHENFGSMPQLELGDAKGNMGEPIFSMATSNYHLLSTWPEAEKLTTLLLTPEKAFEKEYAEGLVAEFNQTLIRFLNSPEASLCTFQSL